MTQYLGIITAYGAVAILAWLAVLLYPRLIPRTPDYSVQSRWREAGLLALAIIFALGLGQLRSQGIFPNEGSALVSALLTLLTYAPVLAYVALRRSRSAILIPEKHTFRSIIIGFVFAGLAVLANYLTTDAWDEFPVVLQGMLLGNNAEVLARALMRSIVVGAFLALVVAGWSNRVALLLAGIAIFLTQVPELLESGFTGEWLAMLLVHLAIVLGLTSAILATRNILWFWPVFTALNLLQLYTG